MGSMAGSEGGRNPGFLPMKWEDRREAFCQHRQEGVGRRGGEAERAAACIDDRLRQVVRWQRVVE